MALPLLAWPVIWAFISAIIAPVVQIVIRSIGFTLVSYVGFQIVISQITDYVYSKYNGLPTDVLKILDLAGVHSALGIMFSTMVGIAVYKAAVKSTGIAWKKPGSGAYTRPL